MPDTDLIISGTDLIISGIHNGYKYRFNLVNLSYIFSRFSGCFSQKNNILQILNFKAKLKMKT